MSSEDDIPFGPMIPPNLMNAPTPQSYIGPVAPPKERIIGPTLPPSAGESAVVGAATLTTSTTETPDISLDMIGPLPEGNEIYEELRHFRPDDTTNNYSKTQGLQREKWMTELAESGPLTSLGLTARQFRTSANTMTKKDIMESRRAWTSVPGQEDQTTPQTAEESRQIMLDEFTASETKKRDAMMQEEREKLHARGHRNKSLMDLHQEKLLKKAQRKEKKKEKLKKSKKRLKSKSKKHSKKKSRHRKHSTSSSSSSSSSSSDDSSTCSSEVEGGPTRVAFDRDRDLRVNVLDDAKRKAIIARSHNLNTRFSSGSQQFL